MNDPTVLLLPVALAVLLLIAMFVRAFIARARFELRAQLFELLRLATSRQLPLAPVFYAAREGEHGYRGRVMSELADRFQAGESIAETLPQVAPRLFGEHHLAAIAAVEGTPNLPSTLAGLAAEMGRGDTARHQVGILLFYPMLLAVMLVCAQSLVMQNVTWLGAYSWVDLKWLKVSGLVVNLVASAVFILSFFVVLLRLSLDRTGNIPTWFSRPIRFVPVLARMTRWVGIERGLQTLSSCVAGGAVLSDALRAAALASGHEPTRVQLSSVAVQIDSGRSLEEALESSGLPRIVVARAVSASTGSPASFAKGLGMLAEECGDQFMGDLQNLIRWAQPVTLLVFGVGLGSQFGCLFVAMGSIRNGVTLW